MGNIAEDLNLDKELDELAEKIADIESRKPTKGSDMALLLKGLQDEREERYKEYGQQRKKRFDEDKKVRDDQTKKDNSLRGKLSKGYDKTAGVREKTANVYTTVTGANGGVGFVVALIAFAIHFYHWRAFDFAPVWSFTVPAYAILAIIIAGVTMVVSGQNFIMFFHHLLRGFIAAAAILGILWLLWFAKTSLSNPDIQDLIGFALLLFPPGVYWIIFSPQFTTPAWVQTVAAIIIAVILVAFVLANIGDITLPTDNFQGTDAKQGFMNTVNRLWDGVVSFRDNAYQAYNKTSQRLDPNYYTGQVEQNEQRPLGVRLEEFEPIDPVFFPFAPVSVVGYISAETFLDDSIYVQTSCYINRRVKAETHNEDVEVYYGADELFECEFPQGFDTGSYTVEVHASFPFETWADITYDFISEEKSRTFARLGVDVYQELDIKRGEPGAIYTNGPIILGMGGSRMPIIVTQEHPYLKNAVLGFTLQSKWPKGTINHVDSLELIIPQSFELLSCDRLPDISAAGPFPDENVPSYHKYVFENIKANESLYTSIRCKMALTSPDALVDLVANDKVTRTFIARASYTYTLVEETKIRVAG